ncbi:UvrD-helicase domain-containing protein [Alteromonas lipolytica]|uniref:Helicase IV n=1 Tax=Alteromonas lipolytica TaxID=1856405 RepID=A0A1E8FF11_9ALTE|nr:UvrD-helicase domain-containing protein [Alteromonas lipolytica]OFI34188.1 helicase IV [Alteromonas lipolytica]GGF84291.1 hypothetical protein GCM10011338_40740 [Alteromonas lipolytica]
MDFVSKLEPNFFGRLLGRPSVISEPQSISIEKKGKVSVVASIKELRTFIESDAGLSGGKIAIQVGKERNYFNFLKKSNLASFIEDTNKNIKDSIEEYLGRAYSEFAALALKAYPRDSRSAELSTLISEVHHLYHSQKEKWEFYLSDVALANTIEIDQFYPFNIDDLRAYHEQIQLEKRKSFFDKVESNPLTLEQRLGVIRSNDLNMVLAAAGTGKTSVMVAKALNLIELQLATPSEVLILAYNRAAAEELKERLASKAANGNIQLESLPHISTFHALGRQLLRDTGIPTQISVFAEDSFKLKQWVTNWIYQYVAEDPTRVFDLIELTTPPVDPFDFKSQAEYEKYLRDNDFRTLNNELVKGYQELLIANFLYINQIPYKYEAQYVSKRRIEVGFDYRPDFHILDTDIYIEHYGIDRKGNTRPDIDRTYYADTMKKKKALHQECGTQLIETFHYEWQEDTLLSGLTAKLASFGIRCKPLSPNEIFEKLNGQEHLASWSELMVKALQAIRVERLSEQRIFKRLNASKIHQAQKYAGLLNSLQVGYAEELKTQNAIDFDDMILRAIQVVQDGEYEPRWKYILVDEFQDISSARMEFVKALIDKGPTPSLTVVGDDWQSIYRFSGGKLELTTRFGELVGKYTLTKLQKTFRYNNSIAKTAGEFIMENPEQFKKHIDTHTKVSESQVYLLDDKPSKQEGLYERVVEVVAKIRENAPDASIAIIARYNYLLNDSKNALWSQKFKDNIQFWSFHKSKGLEADYCVLIGFFQGKSGFPNENRDDAVVEALLPSLDGFPHSEERRLLYVGITRARKKSYIIASATSPSDFVTELLAPKYELNIASAAFKEKYQRIFKCPNCDSGFLRLVQGQFGEFYSCSTGTGCRVGKARVCQKCKAPSIDGREASVCNNPGCANVMKICNKCGRPMKRRNGKFGEFWGCSGYGIMEDQCKNTSH